MQEQLRQPSTAQGNRTGRRVRPFDEEIAGFIRRQHWLEPVADTLQNTAGRAIGALGPSLNNFLHGTWLRHPLHVALTDVPIGAWTTSIVMDALDVGKKEPKLAKGADTALALGVAAAVPTAVTGMADWRHLWGYPRRVGLVHAGLNSVGLILQITSLVLRRRGNRGAAVALSALGYLSTTGAAWFGGELVERLGVGVDHTAFQTAPKDFIAVMEVTDLPEGEPHRVQVKGVGVLLYRSESLIYAIADTCSHQGCSLSRGHVENGIVTCPCHGSRYRVVDGALVQGPSTFDQPRYEVRISAGHIEVRQARDGE